MSQIVQMSNSYAIILSQQEGMLLEDHLHTKCNWISSITLPPRFAKLQLLNIEPEPGDRLCLTLGYGNRKSF